MAKAKTPEEIKKLTDALNAQVAKAQKLSAKVGDQVKAGQKAVGESDKVAKELEGEPD